MPHATQLRPFDALKILRSTSATSRDFAAATLREILRRRCPTGRTVVELALMILDDERTCTDICSDDLVDDFGPLLGGGDGVVTPFVPELIELYLKTYRDPSSGPNEPPVEESHEWWVQREGSGRFLDALLLLIATAGATDDGAKKQLAAHLLCFVDHIESLGSATTIVDVENPRFLLEVLSAVREPCRVMMMHALRPRWSLPRSLSPRRRRELLRRSSSEVLGAFAKRCSAVLSCSPFGAPSGQSSSWPC